MMTTMMMIMIMIMIIIMIIISRLQHLKKVARNTATDSYTAMKRMTCNSSRWKAANESKD